MGSLSSTTNVTITTRFLNILSNYTGLVAKQGDAGADIFGASDEMIEGIRLDHEGGFKGETSVGIIEWDFNTPSDSVNIPFGSGFLDPPSATGSYPFVGSGFTSSTSGRLVPELRATGEIVPPEGAKLFEVNQAGNKVLRAVYANGVWIAQ